ncbi:Mannosylglycerate hydrolase [Limihaloglobus sulfuriphilus]|uniref:Mannosylglycerate hydrolase n=1 Tax=Limihaloglobus sulfuriphilus TaxID=1851148 RepID=A0A1Q2MJE4_9BACT|nr:glycoside hydrolase family 38 C-terminal domain-containing protein [Limihaloglobus sulfuriphilus]AQQ72592.1 Mannosylglycerate hydrolase [Limihaloglobus sulfuriphilus]
MTKKLYFVLSTHWDREWYQSFQDYRYRLVDLIDDVLDGFETDDLKGPFYTDGQVCLLEDYLEVRPEKTDEIKSCLREGKFISGPWYVLPDEFLISGESTVRNLALGIKTTEKFGGKSSRAGFLCDMFGHISQMPQILKQFSIDKAYMWRGTDVNTRNVIWQGADGTQICAYVCGSMGYGDYADIVRNAGSAYESFDRERFNKKILEYIDLETKKSSIDSVLLFDGLDHQCWDRAAYKALLEWAKERPEYELQHTGLDDYLELLCDESSKIKETITGEQRHAAVDYMQGKHTIYGVLSSRVDVKQENTKCQNLLCSWAEPFSAFANLLTGKEYPQGFLDVAWKWLLKNHPHDSICGCSIDQVHEDMKFRFSQCRQIGERLKKESLQSIALATDTKIEDDQLKLTVFNSQPNELSGVFELDIVLPEGWNHFGEHFFYEQIPGFRIFDSSGEQIPYQRISKDPNTLVPVIFRTKTPDLYKAVTVKAAMKLDIPAMGYKTLIVKPAQMKEPVRHPSQLMLAHSGNCLENEYLKASVNANGTINLLDKKSGQMYENILSFEEDGDIGDGWFHGTAVNNEVFVSTAGKSQVSIPANGPEIAVLKIRTVMQLPAEFDFHAMKRSDELKDFVVETYLTLRGGSEKLEVETFIDNNIKDHRLRVVFPTGTKSKTYLTDSVFDVVERSITKDENNYKKKELEPDTSPQQSWTAVGDGKRGLAVISTGLYEAALGDEPLRPIKLSLLRSTRRTVMTAGEPEGQLLKPLSFKYALRPLSGEINRCQLFSDARLLADDIAYCQLRKKDIDSRPASAAKLPPQQGLVSVENAVMTSLLSTDGKIQVRVFNPENGPVNAAIRFESDNTASIARECKKTDFLGNAYEEIKAKSGKEFNFKLKGKEIATLSFS